jgi:hypothetical protein
VSEADLAAIEQQRRAQPESDEGDERSRLALQGGAEERV